MDPRTRSRIRRPSSRPRHAGPWKHGAIPVLGLIGAIGGGKSGLAAALAARGAFVLDADKIGHALLEQRPVREPLVARFGPGILAPTDTPDSPQAVDRRSLGAIVFSDPDALRDLESILHPRMRKTFERAIARVVRAGKAPAIVLDAAILMEAGWAPLCDRVVYVDAPREVRLARLAEQRGWTEEGLVARERAQWPPEQKRRQADWVVDNDGPLEALDAEAERLWGLLLGSPGRPLSPMTRPRGSDGVSRRR